MRVLPGQATGIEHPVPANHWIMPLRHAGGDGLRTREVVATVLRETPSEIPRTQGERFLYYDGLLPRLPSPQVSVADGQWHIALPAGDPCHDVVAAWRRDGQLQVAIAPGAHPASSTVAMRPVKADNIAAGWKVLVDGSIAAGLDAAAAKSLQECWGESLCGDGLTVLWRIPQVAYDRMLPLSATPAATTQIRVGLAHFTNCEPTFDADLLKRIAALADPDQINAAIAAITAYGSAATPTLRTMVTLGRWPAGIDNPVMPSAAILDRVRVILGDRPLMSR